MVYIFLILLTFFSPAYAEGGSDLSAARSILKSGKTTEASTLLQKEINEHPENAEAHHLLGRIYLLEGNEVKASVVFDKDKRYRDRGRLYSLF